MANFVFPRSSLDSPKHLLDLLGSYWSQTHTDDALVQSVLHARAQLDQQNREDFQELLDAMSRFKVRPFHLRRYHPVRLLESKRNLTDKNLALYDGTHLYAEAFTAAYDVPQPSAYHCWDLPANLVAAHVILNRITDVSVTWTHGVDFVIRDGVLLLNTNPFESELFIKNDVYEGTEIVDRAVQIWLYSAEFDTRQIFQQYGYVIGRELASSERYRDYVNGIYDGLVQGTNKRNTEAVLSAICDVDLAKGDETVLYTFTDRNHRVIVTDHNVYRFALNATVLVAAGDVLKAGQSLTDTLQVFEFNRGQVPSADEVPALAIGKGILAAGYFHDLVFENKEVPLVVIPDMDGYTYVEFEIQGAPGDIEKFWGDVHSQGIAKEQTLAMLLDQRETPVGQPTHVALPETINPLGFLCQQVLRHHAFVVRVRPSQFGENNLGLAQLRLLRKLTPPHTLMIVMVQLDLTGDRIIMDGPGTETRPGYTEELRTYSGQSLSEVIVPENYIRESLRARRIQGYCE